MLVKQPIAVGDNLGLAGFKVDKELLPTNWRNTINRLMKDMDGVFIPEDIIYQDDAYTCMFG